MQRKNYTCLINEVPHVGIKNETEFWDPLSSHVSLTFANSISVALEIDRDWISDSTVAGLQFILRIVLFIKRKEGPISPYQSYLVLHGSKGITFVHCVSELVTQLYRGMLGQGVVIVPFLKAISEQQGKSTPFGVL